MKAFQLLLAALAVLTLAWFVIYERRKSANPSKSENALAFGWLIFRRVVCFSAAVFFGVVAIAVLVAADEGSSFWSVAGLFLFCACVAFMAVWVGISGGGRQLLMSDDRTVHQERKKRYGWKW